MNDIEFKEIKVQFPELRTWLDGQEIYPTLTELRLLLVLLSDPYRDFSKLDLVQRLQLTSSAALSVNVWKLRKLLNQKYIITVQGCGYAFAEKRN